MFATWMLRVAVFFTSAVAVDPALPHRVAREDAALLPARPGAPRGRGRRQVPRRAPGERGDLLRRRASAPTSPCSAGSASGLGRFLLRVPAPRHLLAYLGVTVLGCVGYCAVFTLFGLLWQNPILPILALFGWESVLFLLPPLLKAGERAVLPRVAPAVPPARSARSRSSPTRRRPLASVAGMLAFTARRPRPRRLARPPHGDRLQHGLTPAPVTASSALRGCSHGSSEVFSGRALRACSGSTCRSAQEHARRARSTETLSKQQRPFLPSRSGNCGLARRTSPTRCRAVVIPLGLHQDSLAFTAEPRHRRREVRRGAAPRTAPGRLRPAGRTKGRKP